MEQEFTFTQSDLAAAFEEWDRRYRENPEQFWTDVEHLLRNTPASYGEAASIYLISLLIGE